MRSVRVTACLTLLCWPFMAPAADSAAELEEIVVTAQKRREALTDVPIAVQAFHGDELGQPGQRDLTDIISLVPGGSSIGGAGPGLTTLQIRGISSGATGDATVSYYLDELAYGVVGFQYSPPANLFDVERVEVLRGPQGTLYGQGAMGGTIKIITHDPVLDQYEFKGQLGGSDTEDGDESYEAAVAANLPLVTGKLAIRAVAGLERRGGFAESVDFPEESDVNPNDGQNYRVKLKSQFNDRLAVTLGYWRYINEQDFLPYLMVLDPPTLGPAGGYRGSSDSEYSFPSALIEADFERFSVVSASSYIDGTLTLKSGFVIPGFTGISATDFAFKDFTQEVRAISNDTGRFRWIAGAFYRDARSDQDSLTEGVLNNFPINVRTIATRNSESWAVFGEMSTELLHGRVKPLVGLRYFADSREIIDERTTTGQFARNTGDFDSVSPRFNLSVFPRDNCLLYFNVAKGFRSGNLQSDLSVATAAAFGIVITPIIDPDTVWSYELGSKVELLNHMLTIEGAAYYNDWNDIQLTFATPVQSSVNGGDAHTTGLDLALMYQVPGTGLSLGLSGNINESEYDSIDPSIAGRVVTAVEGARLPGVPKSTFTVDATYQREVGSSGLGGYANIAYTYRASQIDLTTGLESANIDDLSLKLGVESETGHWGAYLFGTNILDDRGPADITSSLPTSVYPREIGARVTFKY